MTKGNSIFTRYEESSQKDEHTLMALSLSKYVNRAAMAFDAGERPARVTYIHCIAMSMSNYANRAAMEFDGGSGQTDEHALHGTVLAIVCEQGGHGI